MTGPHGGELVRGYERIVCPIGGGVGTWSLPPTDEEPHRSSVYTPPPGHRIVRDDDDFYVRDYCLGPLDGES